jgi:hypothetical protein
MKSGTGYRGILVQKNKDESMPPVCPPSFPYFNVCEFIGSLFLVIAPISPIILFHNIFEAGIAVAVIAGALAVGFVLFALIEIFGLICTAYFNPAMSFSMAVCKEISWTKAVRYSIAQIGRIDRFRRSSDEPEGAQRSTSSVATGNSNHFLSGIDNFHYKEKEGKYPLDFTIGKGFQSHRLLIQKGQKFFFKKAFYQMDD